MVVEKIGNSSQRIRAVNEYGDGVSWFRGSIIGKGGFGCVYLATLKNSKSKYSFFPPVMAVKSAEVSASGSIQKEREVFSNVGGCPHIIKCFGEETTVGDNGVMVYNLLLEYGSGGTLADKIRKSSGGNGLSEFEVRVITKSVLRGLYHIHGFGYVHCDLKPDNIMLVVDDARRNGFRAKIGDLGLARRANICKKRKLEEGKYWQGTPMYLSPEAVLDNEQEAPSDIWALGCVVLEMLTGKPPWAGEKEEILKKIGPDRELPEIPIGISKEARDFLKGCFVRRSMFRLTAEMLLNHPFIEDLDDKEEGVEEDEDLNEIESILLVSGSDGSEFSYNSCCYWSEEANEEDEIESGISEEGELKVEENEGVIGSTADVGFGQSSKKSRKISKMSG
ncbi:hypothetical protein OROGR_011731 [Orobanche gracilis]